MMIIMTASYTWRAIFVIKRLEKCHNLNNFFQNNLRRMEYKHYRDDEIIDGAFGLFLLWRGRAGFFLILQQKHESNRIGSHGHWVLLTPPWWVEATWWWILQPSPLPRRRIWRRNKAEQTPPEQFAIICTTIVYNSVHPASPHLPGEVKHIKQSKLHQCRLQ